MSSSEKITLDEFLVLGGDHHGEVWLGEYTVNRVSLPVNVKRMGKFYGRDTPAEISTSPGEGYYFTEWKSADGKTYLIASISPDSTYNVNDEISKVSPPLKPINRERPKVFPGDNATISGLAVLRKSKTARPVHEIRDAISRDLNKGWSAGLTVSENNQVIMITAHCLECEVDTVETLIGRSLALIGYDFAVNR